MPSPPTPSLALTLPSQHNFDLAREIETLSRGPVFGYFVTILTERSMHNVTVERSQVIFTAVATK
jgi:hypothetical protein